MRSPTIQPVTRTAPSPTNAGTQPTIDMSVKPKSRWGATTAALLVLGIGVAILWKGLPPQVRSDQTAVQVASDPARRFHVFVKSDPSGADIFVGGNPRPMAATPVSLPIDLNGVSSVKIVLKKEGFEDYEQVISSDDPISINMRPAGQVAPPAGATPDAGVAVATPEAKTSSKSPKRRAKKSQSRPAPAPAPAADPWAP
jgi:hypothetical protein